MTTMLGIRVRQVRARNLGHHHLGRRFIPLGVVDGICITERGYVLHATDGLTQTATPDKLLTYYADDEEPS